MLAVLQSSGMTYCRIYSLAENPLLCGILGVWSDLPGGRLFIAILTSKVAVIMPPALCYMSVTSIVGEYCVAYLAFYICLDKGHKL